MNALEHPRYVEEQQHLEQTLTNIRKLLDDAVPPLGYGGNRPTARELYKMNLLRIDELKQTQTNPYLARVDWCQDGSETNETLYIGRIAVPDAKIYSWASPLASDLYYNQTPKKARGTVLLRRLFEIERDTLRTIRDEFVHRSLVGELGVVEYADRLLYQLLQQHRQGELRDIIATIQAQQFAIIQSPKDQLLIVQGAPGSGKSSIALHRIAYLLYNHKELAPKNILVLGPSRMFLGYIAGILPSLGERQVPQLTFDDWASSLLETPIQFEAQEETLEFLLGPSAPHAEKVTRLRNARNKGSLRMASLLEHYADVLYDQVLDGQEALVCTFRRRGPSAGSTLTLRASQGEGTVQGATRASRDEIRVEVNPDAMRSILERVRQVARPERRKQVLQQVVSLASAEIDQRLRQRGQDHSVSRSVIETALLPQIDAYFNAWREVNVTTAYRRLFRTPELLLRVGDGLFTMEELELMVQDAPSPQHPFRFSDVPGLLYLKIMVSGSDARSYDHIVIDEAQDISPLHFKVLQFYSRSNSMTVLGDLQQGIYAHHGLRDWGQLAETMGIAEVTRTDIRESYRSTDQIITYGNELLRRIGLPDECLAEPIAREGAEPSLAPAVSQEDLLAVVREKVMDARDAGDESIAVICKTAARCRQLSEELAERGVNDVQMIDNRDSIYQGKLAIIPAHLTKGLEFDSIIIVDADSDTYPPDMLHARLLYVAITRAAHSLTICWTGTITPLLDDQRVHVAVQPMEEVEARHAVTVAEGATRLGWNPDRCIIRLAQADKLYLLQDGTIDEVVLEMVLGALDPAQPAESEEAPVAPLSTQAHDEIVARVQLIEQTGAAAQRQPLALLQLVYGILRNHLRTLNLLAPDGGSVAEQAPVLATLARAVTEQGFTLGAGRWTTSKVVLESVAEPRRAEASDLLRLFLNYGLLESGESGGSRREGLRARPEAANPLLLLALGIRPHRLDTDLLQQLILLPEPLIELQAKEKGWL